MKMKLRLKYTTRQPMVMKREREILVGEDDLQNALDYVGLIEFDKQPSAREIIDYFDGRGEFADYIELAARHEDVKALMGRVADGLHVVKRKGELLKSSTVTTGSEGDASVLRARPMR